MKVLFVGSGNKTKGDPSVLIKNQAISLEKQGCTVDFYLIQGKGLFGYLKNAKLLRKKIRSNDYEVIHAHYSLSGFLLTISSFFLNKPKKIVSLMGSDTQVKGIKRIMIQIFYSIFWDSTIVKTKRMKDEIGMRRAFIIPNGVNLNAIHNSILPTQNRVLFAADPSRISKNFDLANESLEMLKKINDHKVELKIAYNLSHSEIIKEIQSSACILVTSRWEGSPNVIKEAMACNRPIVTTEVGDVNWLLNNLEGCFIVKSDAHSVCEGLIKALDFSFQKVQTKGRDRLIELGLDSDTIAKKIITTYKI